MTQFTAFKRFGAGVILASSIAFAMPAFAQEPSAEHVAAARAAIAALQATDDFDIVLPQAAENLKASLIQSTPDLEAEISAMVDEKVFEMVPRRADLEREAALIYAKTFTQEQLTAIASFYGSEPGKALIANGALVSRELLKAADIWSVGIQRDLATTVATALDAKLGDRPRIELNPGTAQ